MENNKELTTKKQCDIHGVGSSVFNVNKFNQDLKKAEQDFAKACRNYLGSTQYEHMIKSINNLKGI